VAQVFERTDSAEPADFDRQIKARLSDDGYEKLDLY
jgi:hypothetical protein